MVIGRVFIHRPSQLGHLDVLLVISSEESVQSIGWSRSVMLGDSRQTWMLFDSKRSITEVPLEIVYDDQCWCVLFEGFPSRLDIWNNDFLHILDHGILIWPMLGRMRDVPIKRKLVVGGVTAWCLVLINDLDRQKNHPLASHKTPLLQDACHLLQLDLRACTLVAPMSKCWKVQSWSLSGPNLKSVLLGFPPFSPWLHHSSLSWAKGMIWMLAFGYGYLPLYKLHLTQERICPVPV